jgi:hypothetical protein
MIEISVAKFFKHSRAFGACILIATMRAFWNASAQHL